MADPFSKQMQDSYAGKGKDLAVDATKKIVTVGDKVVKATNKLPSPKSIAGKVGKLF